jgi:hypothetical protein
MPRWLPDHTGSDDGLRQGHASVVQGLRGGHRHGDGADARQRVPQAGVPTTHLRRGDARGGRRSRRSSYGPLLTTVTAGHWANVAR